MELKIPKIKLKKTFFLKCLYALSAALVIIVFIGVGVFLYKYFYQTIAQSKEVVILRRQVAPEAINIKDVNKILESLDKKISSDGTDWNQVRNPFASSAPPPAVQ